MGLIKAALTSVSSTYSDMWKEYFVCESLNENVLMMKASKKGGGLFNKGDVITSGSGIVVADGQCAIVVDDGVVTEVANEPGNYTFYSDKSPSIFDGGFSALKETFKIVGERFTYEGTTNRSQTVYYVNTKELVGNKFGTASPIPFRVIDNSIGLDMDISLKCNGEYSIRITNPILFYQNISGNKDIFYKDELDSQMRSEFLTALQPAVARLSQKGVTRYSDIPAYTFDLVDNLNEVLSSRWSDLRGISVVSVGINTISPTEEDLKKIQNLQEAKVLTNPNMAAATLAAAQAQAMRDAANNTSGAATGFMGMGFAQNAGSNIASLYEAGNAKAQTGGFCMHCGKPVPAEAAFCPSCGKPLK